MHLRAMFVDHFPSSVFFLNPGLSALEVFDFSVAPDIRRQLPTEKTPDMKPFSGFFPDSQPFVKNADISASMIDGSLRQFPKTLFAPQQKQRYFSELFNEIIDHRKHLVNERVGIC